MTPSRQRRVFFVTGLAVVLGLGWQGAKVGSTLPSLDGRSSSLAAQDTAETRLGKAVLPRLQLHPGQSGVFPLRQGRDAFAARALLADAAERTLDVQYYIWHDDTSGGVLMDSLRRAADRGVRVRLLLDDNNTSGLDALLTALNNHPKIEVRLFNPFVFRRWRALGYLTDFPRLNRRMHNKSFTADNQVTIIGGRNVGDEYFGATHDSEFVDLDLLSIGSVVQDVSRDFDRYWASASAYPLEKIVPAPAISANQPVATSETFLKRHPDTQRYLDEIKQQPFFREMLDGRLQFEWAAAQMVSDDPQKALGQGEDETLLRSRLKSIFGTPQKTIRLISPYFVPTDATVDTFVNYASHGVNIAVLTNSLEATDVLAVHAGYAKKRQRLLQAGITLYELKQTFSEPVDTAQAGPGSSGSSLHAKTFAVDGSRVFVGSFNFDPRSARLNTELGFVVESPELAKTMAEVFATRIPLRSYRVRLTETNTLQWVESIDGKEKVYDHEPHVSRWRRTLVSALSWLPIESLL